MEHTALAELQLGAVMILVCTCVLPSRAHSEVPPGLDPCHYSSAVGGNTGLAHTCVWPGPHAVLRLSFTEVALKWHTV